MTIELSEYVIDAIADAVVKKMQVPSYNSIKTELEPCEDAISRQAVIDTLTKTSGIRGDALKALYDLPSVTPQQRWIPVSERYPEDGQRVLVDYCDEDAGVMLIRFNVNGYRGFKAWMPLPEPYKQEAEE